MLETAVHILFGALALNVLLTATSTGLRGDDTDRFNEKGKLAKRSGLSVLTDYKTGVQYLYLPLAGMTPRLDADGKPVVHPDFQTEQK